MPILKQGDQPDSRALSHQGATAQPLFRAFKLAIVTAGTCVIAGVTLAKTGFDIHLAAFIAFVIASLTGLIVSVPLFDRPAVWTREQIRALEIRIARLVETDRARSFESLDLPKGHELAPLARIVREALEMHHQYKLTAARTRREMDQRVSEKTRIATMRLNRKASTDPLTGLGNRRHLDETLPEVFRACRARGQELAVLAIDMDLFKGVNDTLGHDAGDRALQSLGEILAAQFRLTDIAVRLGGDEFIVALPGTQPAQAMSVAKRIQALFASLPLGGDLRGLRPTLSIGLAALQRDGARGPEDLLRMADQALYSAKRAGRGRICSFNADPAAA